MSKDKIVIDIRHLNLFDALKTVTLKSCEQFALDENIQIHWIVANYEIIRLFAPLNVGNSIFTQVQNKKISA